MRFQKLRGPFVVRFVVTVLILVASYLVYSYGPVPAALRQASAEAGAPGGAYLGLEGLLNLW